MAPLSLKTFLDTIFDPKPDPDEAICMTSRWPQDDYFTNWIGEGRRVENYQPGRSADYFCISTTRRPVGDTKLVRGREALQYLYCLMLDDIGTKSKEPPVAPSWRLESSAGNYQLGYLLDVIKLTPATTAYYEGCYRALAQAGLTDSGAGGTYRVARVPGSRHGRTGFTSTVTEWHPERSWKLADLMDEMCVKPLKQREKRLMVADGVGDLSLVDDELLNWLDGRRLVGKAGGSGFINIVCPWADGHTDGDGSAGYSPAWYVTRGRAFSCFHEHCFHRNIHHLIDWAYAEGMPFMTKTPAIPMKAANKLMELL